MKYSQIITILTITLLSMTGCGSENDNTDSLIMRHIRANIYPDEKLEVAEVTKPDSTFGVMYLPEKELVHITKTTDKVTDFFMKKTKNMTDYDPDDGYLAYLANKQMLVAAEINEIMAHSLNRKEFNGWYVRVTYAVTNKAGKRKMDEYFFFDKKKSFIYNTFTIPLP